MSNLLNVSVFSLAITVVLGVYFLLMQGIEYSEAMFSIRDGAFGRVFYIGTGFHGFHVLVGTLFLFYTLLSVFRGQLLYSRHFSFEAAA